MIWLSPCLMLMALKLTRWQWGPAKIYKSFFHNPFQIHPRLRVHFQAHTQQDYNETVSHTADSSRFMVLRCLSNSEWNKNRLSTGCKEKWRLIEHRSPGPLPPLANHHGPADGYSPLRHPVVPALCLSHSIPAVSQVLMHYKCSAEWIKTICAQPVVFEDN